MMTSEDRTALYRTLLATRGILNREEAFLSELANQEIGIKMIKGKGLEAFDADVDFAEYVPLTLVDENIMTSLSIFADIDHPNPSHGAVLFGTDGIARATDGEVAIMHKVYPPKTNTYVDVIEYSAIVDETVRLNGIVFDLVECSTGGVGTFFKKEGYTISTSTGSTFEVEEEIFYLDTTSPHSFIPKWRDEYEPKPNAYANQTPLKVHGNSDGEFKENSLASLASVALFVRSNKATDIYIEKENNLIYTVGVGFQIVSKIK